ncbi:hypothetical protein GQ55_1G139100 [Panicum hallii var. hallii]|uniref:Uncharacterized protein n=1 Tax=Panicum hallii var. hallii TaxID=1504633 RepID=A0A2T7F575_9POAL|nr:hypothetical protein GQ55_1G139100 [Panicum hallii var. hallii]
MGLRKKMLQEYRFQVLLPSGVSISLTLNNSGEEMSVRDVFLHSVKRELNSAPVGGGKVREIHWDGNFLTDLLDRKITEKIKLSNFDTKSTNILRLHNEKGGFVSTFENMWDLTPQTDLVQELPAEYSTESALVDLTVSFLVRIIYFHIWLVTLSDGPLPQPFFVLFCFSQDNALQAVWSNGREERKLIKLGPHAFILFPSKS